VLEDRLKEADIVAQMKNKGGPGHEWSTNSSSYKVFSKEKRLLCQPKQK